MALLHLLHWVTVFTNLDRSNAIAPHLESEIATMSEESESGTSHAYGIGFDFTPAYGTAAVSFYNGSKVPLARVQGDKTWEDLMIKVSLEPDFRPCGWCTSRMAGMLQALAITAEERLGEPIIEVAVTLPSHMVAAHTDPPPVDRLLKDAFAVAGLDYIPIVDYSSSSEPVLYPENSVLAGHDLGLCQPYTVPQTCTLPCERYLLVGYYANQIEATMSSDTWFADGVNPYPSADYQLGADARDQYLSESEYWEAVRKVIEMPVFGRRDRLPTKVILYGDHSTEPQLRASVEQVLAKYPVEGRTWYESDPEFVAAMGAAEFAKRKPFWLSGTTSKSKEQQVIMGKDESYPQC